MVAFVALREEGVDRNVTGEINDSNVKKSPSARRAWIEIFSKTSTAIPGSQVALREEGVDRNSTTPF